MAKCGIIEEKREQPEFPVRKLIRVRHQGKFLTGSVFGPNYFSENVKEMQESYCYPHSWKVISFREPLISESISLSAYKFLEIAKPEIFNPRWLQAGEYVRASEGIFTNTNITDKKALEEMLAKAEKVNGIYIVSKTIAFAPYETFKQGVQERKEFAESGLARAFEHTRDKKAKKLGSIASKKNYSLGVNVFGFDSVETPVAKVVTLYSCRGSDHRRLRVGGGDWVGSDGYAFGVL